MSQENQDDCDLARLNASTAEAFRIRVQRWYEMPTTKSCVTDAHGRRIATGMTFGKDDVRGPFDEELNAGPKTFLTERYFTITDDKPITLIDGTECREVIVRYRKLFGNQRGATVTFIQVGSPDPLLTERSLGLYCSPNIQYSGSPKPDDFSTEICPVRYIRDEGAFMQAPSKMLYNSMEAGDRWPGSVDCDLEFHSRLVKSPDASTTSTGRLKARYHTAMSTFVLDRARAPRSGSFLFTMSHPGALDYPQLEQLESEDGDLTFECPVIDTYVPRSSLISSPNKVYDVSKNNEASSLRSRT